MKILNALIATNINRVYLSGNKKKEVIYSNLSFEAKMGEVTLISGVSGSGKSSLMKQLALIDSSEGGNISLFGERVDNYSNSKKAKLRARYIGFIFQSFALIQELSVLENCSLPLIFNGMSKKEANKKAVMKLSEFLPSTDVNKKPNELSGGQQQRVAIIRAIIHNPGIIIADEPTGNLDIKNTEKIKAELESMAKHLKCAVIIVSHDLSFSSIATRQYKFIPCEKTLAISKLIRVF